MISETKNGDRPIPSDAASIEPTRISDITPTATPAPANISTLRLTLHASSGVSSSLSGLNTSWCVLSENHRPGEVREQQHDRDRGRHVRDVGRVARRLLAQRRQLVAPRQQEHRRQHERDHREQQHRGLRARRLGHELLRSRPQPPIRNAAPITSSRLPRMEPTIEALTTSCRPFVEREQGDDQLRRVAERDVQQPADARPGAVRQLLGRPAHERRGGHDAERGREEDDDRVRAEEVQHDRDDDERDQQIRPPRPAEQESPQVEGLRRRSSCAAQLRGS